MAEEDTAKKDKKIEPHIEELGKALLEFVQETVPAKGLNFTKDPELRVREVIEYQSRMRVFGMEKFNAPCYVAGINYYLNESDKKEHKAYGTFIMYVEPEAMPKIFRAFGLGKLNEEDEEDILKQCGEFVQKLAEEFAAKIKGLGYGNFVLSEPVAMQNDIPDGMEFPYNQYHSNEVIADLWKERALVINVTLPPSSVTSV